MTQDEAAGGVKHVPPGEGEALWVFGELQTYKLAGEDTGGAFTAFEVTAAPHSAPPPHIHHQADETFYVLEGTPRSLLAGLPSGKLRPVLGSAASCASAAL